MDPRSRSLSPGERRALLRRDPALARELERWFLLQPGGTPQRPVELSSASLVEVRAASTPCPLCHGALRVQDHTAELFGDTLLRVVRVGCTMCGARRKLYYRVVSGGVN